MLRLRAQIQWTLPRSLYIQKSLSSEGLRNAGLHRAWTDDRDEDDGLVLIDATADVTICVEGTQQEAQNGMEEAQQADTGLQRCSYQLDDTSDPAQLQLIAFPGVNAPIPEGADLEKWQERPADILSQV